MLVFCGIQRLFRLQKPWRASTLGGLNPKVMNRSYKAADSLPGQAARLCKCSACAPLFPPWKPFASFSCNLKETGIPKMLRNSVQGRVSPRSGWSGFAISRDVRNREPGPALKNVRIPLCVYFCGFPSTCLHVHICPCTHVYVDVRAQSWVPNVLHLAFWGRVSHWTWVCRFGKVGRPHLPTTHLSLSVLGLQAHATVPSFWMWVPEITLWSLCLYGKLFTDGVFSQTQSFSVVCLIVCDTFKASTYLGQGYVYLKAN